MRVTDEVLTAAREGRISILLEGDSILIPVSSAHRFLEWIEGRYTLIGVEGFTYDGGNLTPLMDCIVDYSHGDPHKSIEFHKHALSEPSFQKAQFLEFVISNKNKQLSSRS